MSLFSLAGLVSGPPGAAATGPSGGAPAGELDAELEGQLAENGVLQAMLGVAAPMVASNAAPPRSPEAFALDPNAAGLGFAPRPVVGEGAPPVASAPASGPAALWMVGQLVQPALGSAAAPGLPAGSPRAAPPAPPLAPSALAAAAWPALSAAKAPTPPTGRQLPPPSVPGRAAAAAPASPSVAAQPGAAAALPLGPGAPAALPGLSAPTVGALPAAWLAAPAQGPAVRLSAAPVKAAVPVAAPRAGGAVRTFSDAPWLDLEAAGQGPAEEGPAALAEAGWEAELPEPSPGLGERGGGAEAGRPAGQGLPAEGGRSPGAEARPGGPARAAPELSAPVPERLELKLDEGGQSIRVAVTKETAGGYGVELRGPRELVPELRALRSELETALGGDEEQGLASFDASADDHPPEFEEPAAGEGGADLRALAAQAGRAARAGRAPMPAPRPLRLLDRFV